MKSDLLDPSRFTVSKAVRQDQAIVDLFAEHFTIPPKGAFGYSYWLRQVKKNGIKMHHAQRLISIMNDCALWLKSTKGTELMKDRWMTNQFQQIAKMGIERYIASKSK